MTTLVVLVFGFIIVVLAGGVSYGAWTFDPATGGVVTFLMVVLSALMLAGLYTVATANRKSRQEQEAQERFHRESMQIIAEQKENMRCYTLRVVPTGYERKEGQDG